jgi:hypothetical protein
MSQRHRVSYEDLVVIAAIEQPDAIERWLRAEWVAYSRDARGLPWTTLQAIDRGVRRKHPTVRYPCPDLALEL